MNEQQDLLTVSIPDTEALIEGRGDAASFGEPLVEGAGCFFCGGTRFVPFIRCCFLPVTPYTAAC